MLEGRFAFVPRDGVTADEVRAFHQEANDYSRSDFPNPDPDGSRGLELHPAFLVRMRRTGETFLDEVGTSGPTLPFLFGRGALMFDRDSPNNPRRLIGEGIKVRATAIAGAAAVVCVGTGQAQPGFTSLDAAFAKDDWIMNNLSNACAFDGNIIGDRVSLNSPTNPTGQGFVGIYDESLERVIAFGFVITGGAGIQKFQVGPDNAMPLAETNASPAFLFSLLTRGTDVDLSPTERSNTIGLVLSARKSFLDELRLMGPNIVAQQILHAPALVR